MLFFVNNSYAQDISYQQNVSYQQELYNQNYDQYLENKQINLKYNSITTQKELIKVIKTTLDYREKLLSAYILLLRSSLDQYKTISPDQTNQLQLQLFNHQVWLNNQAKSIEAIQDKTQLDQYNQTFSSEYIKIQTSIGKSRIQHHINHQQTIIKQIKDFILKLKAERQFDQQAQNWINQIESDLEVSQQHLNLASQKTNIRQSSKSFNDFYKNSKKETDKSAVILNKTIQNLYSLLKKFS